MAGELGSFSSQRKEETQGFSLVSILSKKKVCILRHLVAWCLELGLSKLQTCEKQMPAV